MRTSYLVASIIALCLLVPPFVACGPGVGTCSTPDDCKSTAECRSYTCDPLASRCVYSFHDGDPVTCGNHVCVNDGDCTSSNLVRSSCSNKVCVGKTILP